MGNILSRNPLHKVQLKSKGVATMGGKPVWFDQDINRLNEDGRGLLLGEFLPGDRILVICKDGTFYTTNFDLSNRYQGDLLKVEKFDPEKCWSAIYVDGETGFHYIKRFSFEPSDNVPVLFISDAPGSKFVELSEDAHPQALITFGGKHAKREEEAIDVEEFIGKKGFKAKGKRATAFEVERVKFIEPLQKEEENLPDSNPEGEDPATEGTDGGAGTPVEGFAPGSTIEFDEPTLF